VAASIELERLLKRSGTTSCETAFGNRALRDSATRRSSNRIMGYNMNGLDIDVWVMLASPLDVERYEK